MLLRLVSTDLSLLKGPAFLDTGRKYRVGRSSECSFVVSDLSVSRVHAELVTNASSITLHDLRSMNGTFVDGLRITDKDVQPGTKLAFGSAKFLLAGHAFEINEDQVSEVSTCSIPQKKAQLQPNRVNLRDISDAERRVLRLLLMGMREKEVAQELVLSSHTVHNHVKEIYRKLNVNSRAELLALFVSDSKFRDKAAR